MVQQRHAGEHDSARDLAAAGEEDVVQDRAEAEGEHATDAPRQSPVQISLRGCLLHNGRGPSDAAHEGWCFPENPSGFMQSIAEKRRLSADLHCGPFRVYIYVYVYIYYIIF